MKLRDIPNIISMFRVVLVLPVVWALLQSNFTLALILFAVAGVSDALDGFLAKHNHWESRLGSILDPLADKLLLVCSFYTLAWIELIPMWLFLVVLVRDLVIILGGLVFHLLFGRYELEPSRVSKINTFFQILFVLAVVFFHGQYALTPWIVDALGYIVFATTIISGLNYVWVWGRRAMLRKHNKNDLHVK